MSMADQIEVPKGTVLFRQGDSSDTMFVVEKGRIRLTLGTGADVGEIRVLGPGEFFGEMSLLSGAVRSATAEVIEDSRLLVIGRDAFAMLVRDDLATVTRMLNEQGARLARTNDPLQQQLQRLVRVRVIAYVLQDLGAAMPVPWSVSLEVLAGHLGMTAETLAPIVTELVSGGAGTLEGATWKIDDRTQVDRLIGLLNTLAGGAAATRGHLRGPSAA